MKEELAIENSVLNRMPWSNRLGAEEADPVLLLTREWLVTNALGGFASASVSGACTRRYHGLLVASLPAPLGRQMMLNYLTERVRLPSNKLVQFGAAEHDQTPMQVHGVEYLQEFRLEAGLPVWRYEIDGHIFEKSILLPHQQNTVQITYRLVAGAGPLRLKIR